MGFDMNQDVERILFTQEDIQKAVSELAGKLDEKYKGTVPLGVSVLKGSVMFFCDLVRAMKTPVEMEFMKITSYGSGSASSGMPRILLDVKAPIAGRDILMVEDIVDSGHTLKMLRQLLEGRGAKSFTVVTLLDKPSRREVDVTADYSCFEVGNEFIVGYGLDYDQRYRNLPYIGVLKREIYQ